MICMSKTRSNLGITIHVYNRELRLDKSIQSQASTMIALYFGEMLIVH